MSLPDNVDRLIERSSMGTAAVRRLRARTSRDVVDAILRGVEARSWVERVDVHITEQDADIPPSPVLALAGGPRMSAKGGDEANASKTSDTNAATSTAEAGAARPLLGDLWAQRRGTGCLHAGSPAPAGPEARDDVQAGQASPPHGLELFGIGASPNDVPASGWGLTVLEKLHRRWQSMANKQPDKEARVIGAAVGGALGGIVGAIVAGPVGAAIGAAGASGVGHEVASDAAKKGL